jgi:hypothetical protein
MKTKTETVTAWVSAASRAAQAESLPVDFLAFTQLAQDMSYSGWVKVGTAEITVTYEHANDLREKAAEAIRAQMQEAAAKYQAMQTELQERLNKLLAIGCEVAE